MVAAAEPLRGAGQGPKYGGQHWLIGTSEGVLFSGSPTT